MAAVGMVRITARMVEHGTAPTEVGIEVGTALHGTTVGTPAGIGVVGRGTAVAAITGITTASIDIGIRQSDLNLWGTISRGPVRQTSFFSLCVDAGTQRLTHSEIE